MDPNLIDFNLIETNKQNLELPHAIADIPSTIPTAASPSVLTPFNFSSSLQSLERRESLENNPFDSVQKLVNRGDPFEIVEKEASLKARLNIVPRAEVKLAKLLSLSEENLIDVDDSGVCNQTETDKPNNCKYSGITCATGTSLDSESPPVSMSIKMTPESGSSVSNSGGHWTEVVTSASSADGSNSMGSAKTKKALEYRKHLLKLSISNSTFNSPVSRYMAASLPQKDGVCFSESNCFNSISAILSEAAESTELLSAESPLKFVDDDLMTEDPANKFLQSEKDYDADLEMLKIPILNQLPSPVVLESPSVPNIKDQNDPDLSVSRNVKSGSVLNDLTALRARLKTQRETAKNNNNQDISELLNHLKYLIFDIDAVDDQKKQKASSLLETLSSALEVNKELNSNSAQNMSSSVEPKPITRQGTFDMDLQEKSRQDSEDRLPDSSTIAEETSVNVNLDIGPDGGIPDVMMRSSATYDGEPLAEKDELNLELPEVEPLPPCSATAAVQPDLNDIIEQLSKLLEQNQLTKHALSDSSDGAGTSAANTTATALNPTFIVVMNAQQYPAAAAPALQEPLAKQCSHYVAYLEKSFNDGSPDLTNTSAVMRRRSQSLSIHDKVKIVQLPQQSPAPLTIVSTSGPNTTPPPNAVSAPEFKTPMRAMLRRNSFSSGTPYTTRIATHSSATVRRSNIGSETSIKSSSYYHRSLETHQERQQQHAIVHPMPFKPDLKKKMATYSSADSILKSSGPLKATIPVKKVAPMVKPEYRLGDKTASAYSHKRSNILNSSLHLLTKSGRTSYTSTPRTAVGSAGFPNACSTPTVHNPAIKRTGPGANRPRYSVTPAAKTLAANKTGTDTTSSGLKRRTLGEFKAKSPLKPRVSTIGVLAAANAAVPTKTNTRLPPYIARTPNKGTPVSSSAASTGVSSSISRINVRDSIATMTKHKENKRP